jgi:calcineurin-like phosphoesterase family protein
MPKLSRRARLLAVATVLAIVAGFVLVGLVRPWMVGHVGDLSLPLILPSKPVDAEVLLAVGDIGSCDGLADEAVADLASQLPGTIALLGDVAYDEGTAAQFEACFAPAWGPMQSRFRPTPGNHDYETPGARPYFDYFGAVAGHPGEGWYSYDIGAWHVVVLNSNCAKIGGCDAGSAQLAWLKQDLAANPAACLLAYWHHARYSSGLHGSHAGMDPLWAALDGAGLDVALAGHDHSYERVLHGHAREFVVGTGGRSLFPFLGRRLPTTEARHGGNYGVLWLALADGRYEWQFLPLGGTSFADAGTGDCG